MTNCVTLKTRGRTLRTTKAAWGVRFRLFKSGSHDAHQKVYMHRATALATKPFFMHHLNVDRALKNEAHHKESTRRAKVITSPSLMRLMTKRLSVPVRTQTRGTSGVLRFSKLFVLKHVSAWQRRQGRKIFRKICHLPNGRAALYFLDLLPAWLMSF